MHSKSEFRELSKIICNGDSFIHTYTGYSFDYRGCVLRDLNAEGEYVRLPGSFLTAECFALAGLLDVTEMVERCRELINEGLYLDDKCWALWQDVKKEYRELMVAWLPAQRR